MCVSEMGKLRLIDLSKPLDPATETRRCHLFRFNTGGPIPIPSSILPAIWAPMWNARTITMTTGRT